jgi:hypothetical protein
LEFGTSLILTPTTAEDVVERKRSQAADDLPKPAQPIRGFSVSGTGGGGSEMVPSTPTEAKKAIAPIKPIAPGVPAEPPDETEICSGACGVVSGMDNGVATHDSTAVASLPISELGYAPHEKREIRSFDNETTLTYLDANNLLCTFEPHQLRERNGWNEEASYNVRAVLIDPVTHSIKRVMKWRVRGDNQYLWRVAGGRVLVHMGDNLELYDAELKQLRAIHVDGRVAWVVSSPTGDHLAIGTVKERHSEAVHRELAQALAEEPEEDIEIRVFDHDFKVLLTAQRSSKAPVPVLSDSGELRVHGDGHGHWKITEFRWDRTEHTIVRTNSACRPTLSTPERKLIFVVGCTISGGRWYRMLRPDGHPLLKGESPSDEIEQFAQGAVDGAFAVRIVKTRNAWSYGQPFTRADLTKENISIYRSSDGATLSAVTSDNFALSQMAFALSPSGDQMALVGRNSILFYTVNVSRR